MENCISDVRAWMISSKLKINDSKTEFLIIGSRQMVSKVSVDSIKVGNADIIPSNCAHDLGVWLDSRLLMDIHISKICSKSFAQLYKLRKIRQYLTPEATTTIVHAFITSNLDYCNSLLCGLPKCYTDRLQRIQNAAARLVCLMPKFCHITPLLKELHWLPVVFRVRFKVLLFVFKALNGMAPNYLAAMICPTSNNRYSLRSNDTGLLVVPRTNHKSFGDRSFAVCGPVLWNQLPQCLRQETTIEGFKSKLKTHLFKEAF